MSEETIEKTERDCFVEKHPAVLEACERLAEQYGKWSNGKGDWITTAEVVGAIRNAEKEYDTTEPEPCDHPQDQRSGYHDSSVLCKKCGCIIEQHGKPIDDPAPLFSY